MKKPAYTHTLSNNILGEIRYAVPWVWIVYYRQPSHELTLCGITKAVMMKTGCTVLHLDTGEHVVLTPTYSYIHQRPQKKGKRP